MTGLDRPLPLRPMGLGDILDGAVQLFVLNWRAVLLTVAVVIVPVQLVIAWLQRDLAPAGLLQLFTDPAALDPSGTQPPFSAAEGGGLLLAFAVSVLVLPVVVGAVCIIAGGSYVGRPVAWGAALQSAGRRSTSLVGATVLIYLCQLLAVLPAVLVGGAAFVVESVSLILLALLLLLLGGAGTFAIEALYAAAPPVIVTENLGAVEGMGRSWRLRRPRFWPTIGAVLVAWLLVGVVGFMIREPAIFAATRVGGQFAWLGAGVAEVLAQLVRVPFLAIVSTLLYFDGRIRREGLDLQISAGELSE